ncbi:MAG: glycosyltransferase [Hyphomonadaceae bacterium]
MTHVVFVAPPFAGHLYPMIPLARAAREAGWRVEVLTGEAKLDTLRRAGHAADTLPSLGAEALEAIANTDKQVGSNPLRLAAQMRQAFALIRDARDEMIARWRTERPDLIVADFAAVPAGLAADALSIPWITTIRPAFALETTRGPPSYLGGWGPVTGLYGAIRDATGNALVRGVKDALAFAFRGEMRALGLRRRRADGSEAIYSPRAILAFDMTELEFPRAWPKALHFIGPVSENPEPPLPLALPPAPRVLVTLGTHLPWAKRTLLEDVRALAARMGDVSFVISNGDAANANGAALYREERIVQFSYVPYVEHLSAFDAIIHHGGAGVTGACIEAGKPALVIPHDYDQFDYAARIVHYGLGLKARRIGNADAARKLARLLNEPRPKLGEFQAAARRYDPGQAFLGIARGTLAARAAQS